jgi:energy-coupling factor transporter ATP-binding protein EcfA2
MAARSKRGTFATKLVLKNIKSFIGDQVLDLTDGKGNPARWTLLLGDNGVGKTTLLECLVQLTPVFNSGDGAGEPDPRLFIEPLIAPQENSTFDAFGRVGATDCTAIAFFATAALLDREVSEETIQTCFALTRSSDGKVDKLGYSKWPEKPEDAIPESKWDSHSHFDQPLVLAYGAGRHMGVGNLDFAAAPEPTDSLLEQNPELFDAEELLMHFDYASLQPKAAKAKRQKALLIETVAELLPEVGSADRIKIYGAAAIGEQRRKGVYVETADGEVPLRQLSFGYQTMIAWVGDIAWRLFQKNPNSTNPLAEAAIVVIDEIDLHLHPTWQRQIRDLLSKHFPNVQFIATAHSPLIAQSFLDANLAVIRRDGDHSTIENDPVAVENWRVDQIVTSGLFDLPSPWPPAIDALFDEQSRLQAKASPSQADQRRLRQIEEQMLKLPTENRAGDDTAMQLIRDAAARIEREGAPS